MLSFIGDYTCKLDNKGRVVVPSAFRKGMAAVGEGSFVLRRNIFEKCIDLYPKGEWLNLIDDLRNRISLFDQEESCFKREFFRGVFEVDLDGNGRILIPKKMLDEIEVEGDIVMVGQDSKIEIWDKINYEESAMNTEDFVNLTTRVFGKQEK
ncbi:division/cell wall cluster transcriptional repressor MraZ [uncultured Sanguibacteroides sp.]|uniref:division/cell wall cluster transcriptional repressor MraZ n=1 Tax=uncultured Sanguibacteroides sp. TaxID=1635151 RepID=UPI0025EC2216|nr:division/cell wall cluster transcriptional repressor MraZ [uncultured Sanguibacteroides sp.]